MIEIQGLVRRYGTFEAVSGLTLSIPAGEVFGLLGPNGAGKSTTLRVLATLIRPTEGVVRLAGFDVATHPDDVRQLIGYVPEGAELYDALTGLEFLELIADLHRLPREVTFQRSQALLDAFAMRDEALRPIGEYSKGMKQKILIAAALQHEPRILLLDEPLDGLDVAAQDVLKRLIRAQAERGGVVVYSSHILEVVERVCDRVGIIHRGRLVAEGSPAELRSTHRGETLAEVFLGLTGAASVSAAAEPAGPPR